MKGLAVAAVGLRTRQRGCAEWSSKSTNGACMDLVAVRLKRVHIQDGQDSYRSWWLSWRSSFEIDNASFVLRDVNGGWTCPGQR